MRWRRLLRVITGHSPSKDGRERPYVPVIPLRWARRGPKRDGGVKPGHDRVLLKRLAISLASIAAFAIAASTAWVYSLGPAPLGKDIELSHVVLDRDGRLLRAYATKDGRWRLPATVEDVDPRFLKLLFAYEDRRFYEHHGVDPVAMARAAWQLDSSGHIISGGSTLTKQVARLLEPREHRTFAAKLRQVTRALELEQALTKNEILSLYLTLAPYGGNLEGIRAASL